MLRGRRIWGIGTKRKRIEGGIGGLEILRDWELNIV